MGGQMADIVAWDEDNQVYEMHRHGHNFKMAPERLVLPPGSKVVVQNLLDFPELNGRAGTVVCLNRQSGRYEVQLDDGYVRAIRPSHVHASGPPAEDREFA